MLHFVKQIELEYFYDPDNEDSDLIFLTKNEGRSFIAFMDKEEQRKLYECLKQHLSED